MNLRDIECYVIAGAAAAIPLLGLGMAVQKSFESRYQRNEMIRQLDSDSSNRLRLEDRLFIEEVNKNRLYE